MVKENCTVRKDILLNNTTRSKKDKWEGNTRLRSDGRWETKICINGNIKSFYGKTESESKKKMRDYRNQVAAGFIEPKKILFGDYCYEWLCHIRKKRKLRDSTFDRYESTFNTHINNTIGKKKLALITHKDIQTLLDNKANPIDGSIPLSQSSVKKISEIIFPCFYYAVSHKHINEDPCIDVSLPLEEDYIKQTKETTILDDEQIEEFKKACLTLNKDGSYKYKFGLYFIFILNTGLRCGELLAANWNDIVLIKNKKFISINKAVQSNIRNRNDDITTKRINKIAKPKTNSGIRKIPLNQQALTCIEMIQLQNKNNNINTQYIFSSNTGTMARARNLQRTLDVIISDTNLPHVSMHDLRRTFGSTLLRKGVDISVVSKLLGHKNIDVTYNYYIKILEEQKVSAVDVLDI